MNEKINTMMCFEISDIQKGKELCPRGSVFLSFYSSSTTDVSSM